MVVFFFFNVTATTEFYTYGHSFPTRRSSVLVSGQLWTIGAVFFGLWLVPMGTLVLRSGWMPRLLGWTLVVGGVGYVVSAFAGLVPGLSTVSMVATLPA